MKNNSSKALIIATFLIALNGCVNETFAPIKDDCINPGLESTKTIAQIYAQPNSTANIADNIIEGYVVSSDEGGNFYQSIYLQPLDKSKGFNISVDIRSAYLKKFQPGKKVFVKLKGLASVNQTGQFANGLIIGATPTAQFAVDRLENYENIIVPSCDVVSEDLLVNKITIAQASAPNNDYLNTLVEIDEVQFDDLTANKTFDPVLTDSSDGNSTIKNVATNTTLIVRTSRFANFSGFKTPTGNGKIRGVLTNYGGTYQIILRTERDVKMSNPRILVPTLPIGGTEANFSGSLNETFESYDSGFNLFPKYINDKLLGNKYWSIGTFSGNKYIEMSAFNSNSTIQTYFVIPVNFTTANSLRFKLKAAFFNGEPLTIGYIKETDFIPGFFNQFSIVDITPSFNFIYPAVGQNFGTFNSAGVYNIPSELNGNGYFVFSYNGKAPGGTTTTMQIDDIVIN